MIVDVHVVWYYSVQLDLVLRGCVTKPDKHGEGQNTLNSGSIEVSHGCLADSKLSKLPQEMQTLMGFAYYETGV